MKVKHSITPNNMDTRFEGIKMRFSPGAGYGGVKPVTLESLEALGKVTQPAIGRLSISEEEMAAIEQGFAEASTQTSSDLSLPIINPSDKMLITSGFGPRTPPIGGASDGHAGIDVGIPVGTPLFAVNDGTVVEVKIENEAGKSKGYGLRTRIRWNDDNGVRFEALYAHCTTLDPAILGVGFNSLDDVPLTKLLAGYNPGVKVEKGQLIALSGGKPRDMFKGYDLAGTSTGPHLHFEIREIPKGKDFWTGSITHNPIELLPGPFHDRNGNQIV